MAASDAEVFERLQEIHERYFTRVDDAKSTIKAILKRLREGGETGAGGVNATKALRDNADELTRVKKFLNFAHKLLFSDNDGENDRESLTLSRLDAFSRQLATQACHDASHQDLVSEQRE